jgi:hypothetical protein
MAIENTVLSAFRDLLKNDATLCAYVKNVFFGVRDGIPEFPCLIVEPSELQEADDIYGRQELRLKLLVIGFIQCMDPEMQIVGDSVTPGVVDFLLDVKKAISADRTLGGVVIQTYIQNARFEYVEYPLRSFNLSIEILYRQGTLTRT